VGKERVQALIQLHGIMGKGKRHPSQQAGLIFHSDRGTQCASRDFRDVLSIRYRGLMSRRGYGRTTRPCAAAEAHSLPQFEE